MENFTFSKDLLLESPAEDKTYRFVVQVHSRGRSVHLDFRYELKPGSLLLGWTIDAIKRLDSDPESDLQQAKELAEKQMPTFIKILKDPLHKWVVQEKAPEPSEWLTIDNATFKPGTIGATKEKYGHMWILDEGTCEYGTQKSTFHELFCHSEKTYKGEKIWGGRLIFRLLPNVWRQKSIEENLPSKTGEKYTTWLCFFADPFPYVISARALKEKWYPPDGVSALPKAAREQIPKELQYWKKQDQAAKDLRDVLISKMKSKEVQVKFEEDPRPLVFAKQGRPRIPEHLHKAAAPQINTLATPRSEVRDKIISTLLYKPPPKLRFNWVLGRHRKYKSESCADCQWLASQSPFTISNLPTWPLEGKTYCRDKCDCGLDVLLPDGTHYEVLPISNPDFYNNPWVIDLISKLLTEEIGTPIERLWTLILKEFNFQIMRLKALIIDVDHMDRLDKAFMAFAGQPLVKDWINTWNQANKEVLLAADIDLKTTLGRRKLDDLPLEQKQFLKDQINAVMLRLVYEDDLKDVEKQLGFVENFIQEIVTSQLLGGIVRYFFKTLVSSIRVVIKHSRDLAGVKKWLESAISNTELFRWEELTKRMGLEREAIQEFLSSVRIWSLDLGKLILKIVDRIILFWKDCVLIWGPGIAIRNAGDNFIKACNEMLNAALKSESLWPFWLSKKVKLLDIPDCVAKSRFSDDIVSIKKLEGFWDKTRTWWNTLRNTLYESLLTKPEEWFRKGMYAGKLKQYEKELIAAGRNPLDFYELRFIQRRAIEEVNRIFFDYSKKISLEIPLAKLFPFFKFNVLNTGFWLLDYIKAPWKLAAIRATWQWWTAHTGAEINYKLRDKLPFYLVPGVYFNPLSWVSSADFIKLFAIYKGEPKWLAARDKHLKWQVKYLKSLPAKQRTKILKKKSVQDYLDRQKFKWVKVTVDFLDQWLGLFPIWKKILAHFQLAETEEYKCIFPQSELVSALTTYLFNDFYGTISKPSSRGLSKIYNALRAAGLYDNPRIPYTKKKLSNLSLMNTKNALDVISKENNPTSLQQLLDEERGANNRKRVVDTILSKINRIAATKIYKAWEVQKRVIAYFTGMFLTRSWKEIYLTHDDILKQLER